MKVTHLHIIGISKNANDDEVNTGVDNIQKRYNKLTPKPTIFTDKLSLTAIDGLAGLNKKAKKAQTKMSIELYQNIVNFQTTPTPSARVGAYIVFHGGTDEPVNFKGLAWLVLYLTEKYGGALQKVVLSACYLASQHPSFTVVPFDKFCSTLFLEADNLGTKLPMLAAWRNDVYVGNSSAKTGHTQTKSEGKYISIDNGTRTSNKVIAIRSSSGYKVKEYADAADDWHDGAVELNDGVVVHVKS